MGAKLQIAAEKRITELYNPSEHEEHSPAEAVRLEYGEEDGKKYIAVKIDIKPAREGFVVPRSEHDVEVDECKRDEVLQDLVNGAWEANVATSSVLDTTYYWISELRFHSVQDVVRSLNAISPPDKQIDIPEQKSHPRVGGSKTGSRGASK